METKIESPALNPESCDDVTYWKNVNRQCCEYDSIVSVGAWMEADKLNEVYEDDLS